MKKEPPPEFNDRWLTIAEACELANIDRRTIDRALKDRGLPFSRLGKKTYRIRLSHFNKWMDSLSVTEP